MGLLFTLAILVLATGNEKGVSVGIDPAEVTTACNADPVYARTTAFVEGAGRQIQAGGYAEAIRLVDQGLLILDHLYDARGSIDDTDQKLIAAEIQQQDGRLESAARFKLRLLSERLDLYRIVLNCSP